MKHNIAVTAGLIAALTALTAVSGCAQRLHGSFRADDATVLAIDRETNMQRAEFAQMESQRAAREAQAATPESPPPSDYYGPVPAQRTYPESN